MNWHSVLFWLFASLSAGFAGMVVYTSNVVRMAFYLVLCLSSTSGLFFLAGADFVGAMQLMIYVGGTLVLLIFGVMLTAQQRFVRMKPAAPEVVTASLIGLSLLLLLGYSAWSVPAWRAPNDSARTTDQPPRTATPIAMGLVGLRVDATDDHRSGYLLPFELVSVHLLVVLVGAAYLARTRITGQSLGQSPPGGFDQDHAADEADELEEEPDGP